MGKWVVCSRHSSNEFFFQFPNCLPFSDEEDFAACVSWALRHDPEDLSPALRCVGGWGGEVECGGVGGGDGWGKGRVGLRGSVGRGKAGWGGRNRDSGCSSSVLDRYMQMGGGGGRG